MTTNTSTTTTTSIHCCCTYICICCSCCCCCFCSSNMFKNRISTTMPICLPSIQSISFLAWLSCHAYIHSPLSACNNVNLQLEQCLFFFFHIFHFYKHSYKQLQYTIILSIIIIHSPAHFIYSRWQKKVHWIFVKHFL